MHDRIIKQVIKRRFQSSGIHDNLQNGMMGLWIPFETFPSVVHGDMRIKADAMLSGCRSCLVTVRDLPADHDEPLTPERPLRRNPVGHKQSAKPDWGLSSFRSLRLTSPIQRPFHQKVDQPVAPVIVPLDASGHPNHPGAVGPSRPRSAPGGEISDTIQPCPLLRPDRNASSVASLRLQAAMA
jgi:hypothetical protein